MFPRSRERGHIEVNAVSSVRAHACMFPRSRERGHIEVRTELTAISSAVPTFPRSRERGHIEVSLYLLDRRCRR